MRAFSLFTFASAVALVSTSPAARPCTCSVPPIAQALGQAEAAFVGTVNSDGLDQENERRVVVFTRNVGGKRLTHLCSGNAPAHLEGPWPRELDRGWSPNATESHK